MTRQKIRDLIQKTIEAAQKEKKLPSFKIPEILVKRPEEKTHGDYATNIALQTGKTLQKNPMEIANLLGLRFKVKGLRYLDKVEVVEPGFINFFLSKEYLQKQVGEILKQGESFGKIKIGRNQKVQVEFISANPTGPLHIGNGRGAFFGDTISNILEWAGYRVTREYFINDAKVNTQIKLLGQTALGKGVTYLNDYLQGKISKLKSQIFRLRQGSGLQAKLTEGEAGYFLAQEVQKDIKNFIEKKLKIKFDNWVSEEDLNKKNKVDKIFRWLKNKKLVYQKDGAWWLKTSQFGDSKDWVAIRGTGESTYFLSDIAYHKDKFDRGFSKIIDIWGADHQGHVSKMQAASKILGYKGTLDILISQLVRLKKGLKISKRKGEIITLEDLLNEVGLDVARFLYLIKSLDTQMEFDIELAKEQSQKNPVFYVQYAHARICSILRKSKIKNQKLKINFKLVNHPSELELIKQLIRFPEIIGDTAKDYQVQRLPQYAMDLATVFHQFYRDCRVISENKELTQVRLALVLATKIGLKNTLELMGISAPERM